MVPPPIQVGQLDHRVGQVEPQGRTQIAVDNPQIEIQTPAHQRPVADKVEQVAQALFHRHAVVQVHTAQTVNANRLAVQAGRPRHAQVQRRARLNPAGADRYRGHRDQFGGAGVQPGGLAIQRHHFVARWRREQMTIGALAVAPPLHKTLQHR